MTTPDNLAYDLAARVRPDLTEAERHYVLAVARAETHFGHGWKGEGAGSNNWGAITGTGPAGSFGHKDHTEDGQAYIGKFKKYNTAEEGFDDLVRVLLKPNVRAAVNHWRSLRQAVYAQKANNYFALDPDQYLAAVVRNYDSFTENAGQPKILSRYGRVPAGVAGVLGAVLGASYLLRDRVRRWV